MRFLPAFLLIAFAAGAQDSRIPTPEYNEVFYRYDAAAGTLVNLERQVAAVESKPKAMGFGGLRVLYYLRGARSPVRFPADSPHSFVFSLPAKTDPSSVPFMAPPRTKEN